jgi:signal transduction histidine kinase
VAAKTHGPVRPLMANWARRVVGFLRSAEPRPALSRSAIIADAAIAAGATLAVIVAAIQGFLPASGAAGRARLPGLGPLGVLKPPPGPLPSAAHLSTTPSWLLLGIALTAAPLAFRRMYPTAAFCVILVAVIATSHYATVFTFAAAIFAAYCAVVYSRYRGIALLTVVAGAIIITAAYPDTTRGLSERYTPLLILIPTVALGSMMRMWRLRAGDSAERLRRAEAEHEAETRRAIELERVRIASELHDVVTHNVSVMVIQAGAARQVLGSSPGDAREALLAVEASGRTAMTELRYMLGLLAPTGRPGDAAQGVQGGQRVQEAQRVQGVEVGADAGEASQGVRGDQGDQEFGLADAGSVADLADAGSVADLADAGSVADLADAGDVALSPQPGAAQIPALLARVCAAGLPVELTITAPARTRRALPPGIDLAAYRIVQEALTNVMKHAGRVHTVVHLEYRPRELLITVSDDGCPPDAPAPDPARSQWSGAGGRGLIGLRERIAIYGGELDAGPRPGGGWRVKAAIPLEPVAEGQGADADGADEDVLIRADFQATST